ncbi:MAG: DUF819 family protein [Pseudomonadota bacterium]|nr:DUF819 family protein [Pseudomonadota bacterium]
MLNPDNHLGIFAALIALAAIAFWLQTTRIGALLTGTVLVILMAIVAANAGLIPHQAPAYDFVFTYLVPVLIPLFLLQGDVRRLLREASRTTLAFIVASAGTVAGVLLAISLLDLSALAGNANIAATDKQSAIAGLFAATYIGGSVNYAALGEMTGLSNDASFFSAATAADNLFSAIFLSVLGLLPGIQWLARRFDDHPQTKNPASSSEELERNTVSITPTSLCTALAVATLLVTLSDAFSAWLNFSGGRYIILTILTLALATMVPKLRVWCTGGFELGVVLSFVFFGSIAAGADVVAMLSVAPILIALVSILLTTHLICLLVVGRWLKLTLPELLTASNAAVLGATTAPAMAAAKGWHDQITPGVLVGVLGYSLGTLIGGLLFNLL